MNCKLGDLAVIVQDDFESNVGRFVRVIEPAENWADCDWLCEAIGGEMAVLDPFDISIFWDTIAEFPDAWLRPIRGASCKHGREMECAL